MEPLYPLNIVERTFPILRELREKEEKEESMRPFRDRTNLSEDEVVDDVDLYENVPYGEGEVGRNLNTLA